MSTQRIEEVASICFKFVPGVTRQRAREIASAVGIGYLKVVEESEEWKSSVGICNINSLDLLLKELLGKDSEKILGRISPDLREVFGFKASNLKEEPCFVWAWRAYCLLGRQFHHSHVTPPELAGS